MTTISALRLSNSISHPTILRVQFPTSSRLARLSSLVSLDILSNRFFGLFPESLAEMVCLESLDLSSKTSIEPGSIKTPQNLILNFNEPTESIPGI
ncbi:hypothetical protein Ahy_A10g050373 isoform C [Arachis hypogaea]|uniref:Uncharacterized protein n=1 Tax=Arachis hypogaea TaxID=3818 RepID=A0A445B992_ARAHY|nr:hypothetical protein Ahy_A10g050373 isoform C [Arachis hypogaea]